MVSIKELMERGKLPDAVYMDKETGKLMLVDFKLPDMPDHAKESAEIFIKELINQLDAVCDGASTDDGVGFAGQHTRRGKRIAHFNRAGYSLRVRDIEWAQVSLPYYFNTQLKHVDKENWKLTCSLAMELAADNERAREKTQAAAELKLLNMPITEVACLLDNIPKDIIEARDIVFLQSLQRWFHRNKSWSAKQFIFVCSFLIKYGKV